MNAASLAFDGLLKPLIFLTNCSEAARTSSGVTGGSKLKSVLMFLHMAGTWSRAERVDLFGKRGQEKYNQKKYQKLKSKCPLKPKAGLSGPPAEVREESLNCFRAAKTKSNPHPGPGRRRRDQGGETVSQVLPESKSARSAAGRASA